MPVVTLTRDNFNSEVESSEKPVLIDFFAKWCGPCKMVSPIVDEIADESSDYKICKIDVDEEPELASDFQVSSIPTLIVFKDGKIINKGVGARSKKEIIRMLEG